MQGPQKKYPPVPFARFMDVKSKGFAKLHEREEELSAEARGMNTALGMPTIEMPIVTAAA
jgi:hypothetical protein